MNDNRELSRFENHVGDAVVFASYKLEEGTLYINYVEAPPALRGTGEAGKLMAEVMDHARKQSYKGVPICSYAVSWIRRHPEYQDML